MSVCPDASILCHFWDLADLRPRPGLPTVEGSGMVIHHPYLARFEGGHFEQPNSPGFRDHHGREFCSYDHFRHYNGVEVWQEPASGGLLSRRWRGISVGCGGDFAFHTLMLPEFL